MNRVLTLVVLVTVAFLFATGLKALVQTAVDLWRQHWLQGAAFIAGCVCVAIVYYIVMRYD